MRNALTLQQSLHEGRLQVHGGFRSARYDAASGAFVVEASEGRALSAPWLVNATSFSMDVDASADPLVRQLCGQGQARAHALVGFDLDFATGCLLDRDGRRVPQVSVLGSLAAGTYFWTTSMEVNARLAQGQAVRLASECALAGASATSRTP